MPHQLSSTHEPEPPRAPTPIEDLQVGDIVLVQREGWANERTGMIAAITPMEIIVKREMAKSKGTFSLLDQMRLPRSSVWVHRLTKAGAVEKPKPKKCPPKGMGAEARKARYAKTIPFRQRVLDLVAELQGQGLTLDAALAKVSDDTELIAGCDITVALNGKHLQNWRYKMGLQGPRTGAAKGKQKQKQKPKTKTKTKRTGALPQTPPGEHVPPNPQGLRAEKQPADTASTGADAAPPTTGSADAAVGEAPRLTEEQVARVRETMKRGRFILAVKDVRSILDCYLVDAKRICNSIEDGTYVCQPDDKQVCADDKQDGAHAALYRKACRYALAQAQLGVRGGRPLSEAIQTAIDSPDWHEHLPIPSLADVLELAAKTPSLAAADASAAGDSTPGNGRGPAPEPLSMGRVPSSTPTLRGESAASAESTRQDRGVRGVATPRPPEASSLQATMLAGNIRSVVAGLVQALDCRADEIRGMGRRLVEDGARFAGDLEAAGKLMGVEMQHGGGAA